MNIRDDNSIWCCKEGIFMNTMDLGEEKFWYLKVKLFHKIS